MRRADTTTSEYQLTFRGSHMVSTGLYAYPRRLPSGRVRHQRIYIRCNCGWKLVDVPRSGKTREKADQLLREHLAEIRELRRNRPENSHQLGQRIWRKNMALVSK